MHCSHQSFKKNATKSRRKIQLNKTKSAKIYLQFRRKMRFLHKILMLYFILMNAKNGISPAKRSPIILKETSHFHLHHTSDTKKTKTELIPNNEYQIIQKVVSFSFHLHHTPETLNAKRGLNVTSGTNALRVRVIELENIVLRLTKYLLISLILLYRQPFAWILRNRSILR